MTASRTPTTAEGPRCAGLRRAAARVELLETVQCGDHPGVLADADRAIGLRPDRSPARSS